MGRGVGEVVGNSGSSPGLWWWCGVWLVCMAMGCGPVEQTGKRCAPEQGWGCPSGEVCVDGVCTEAPEAGEACTVVEKRSCEEGCAGVRTCGADGTWGRCETCEQGQRCVSGSCVCDPGSCAEGCSARTCSEREVSLSSNAIGSWGAITVLSELRTEGGLSPAGDEGTRATVGWL